MSVDAAAAPPRTAAERAALVAGVEGLIVTIVRQKCPRPCDHADLMQDCRLAVWQATAKHDPARTPWPAYAARVIRRAIGHRLADLGEAFGRMPTFQMGVLEDGETVDVSTVEVADATDPVADAWAEFRRAMTAVGWAVVLADLPPKSRRLVELVAVDGVGVTQAADQLGQPVKAVRRNLMAAVECLVRAGHVTPVVLAEAGLTDADLARWPTSRPRASTADRKARRALIAECGEGVPNTVLADLLGCVPNIVGADRRALKAAGAEVAG